MSWHCGCEDSTSNEKPWAHVHVASIDGGIPLTFVIHLECLRDKLTMNEDCIIGEYSDLRESFDSLIEDAKENQKGLKFLEEKEGGD